MQNNMQTSLISWVVFNSKIKIQHLKSNCRLVNDFYWSYVNTFVSSYNHFLYTFGFW